ncbi:MAG: L,D-transpeptidase [Bdellovibrio sp.]
MKLLLSALVALSFSVKVLAGDSSADGVVRKLSKRDQAAQRYMVEEPYEAPFGKLFNEEAYLAGETDLNQFVNVIVVNKSASGPGAQTLRLYVNRQLVLTTKVSTGTEELEYISRFKRVIHSMTQGAKTSHWRHTSRGFYTVKRVYGDDYRSGESGYQMPYAMFFDDEHGLAVHQVPPDIAGGEAAAVAALGSRASSGCVRVGGDYIRTIHDSVVAADKGQIPVIDSKTGLQVVDAYGKPKFKVGYRSIVIVEDY